MSAKDDLKQALREAFYLMAANSVVYQDVAASKTGLRGNDLLCMEQLLAVGPLTAGEIAQRVGLSSAAVTALVDRLQKAGYVKREHGTADRRTVRVVPMREKFQAEVGRVTETLGYAIEGVMGNYSKGDLRVILEFLGKANAVTVGEIERLRG